MLLPSPVRLVLGTSTFNFPDKYFERIQERDENLLIDYNYERSPALEKLLSNYDPHTDDFEMKKVYNDLVSSGKRPKTAIDLSIQNHANQIFKNTDDYYDALEIIDLLAEEIEYRNRIYCSCLHNATDSYALWLIDTYTRKLKNEVRQKLM